MDSKKIIVADRYMTLESVKPNKDCNVCDHYDDYTCFIHEHEQIKKESELDEHSLAIHYDYDIVPLPDEIIDETNRKDK
jgi:hypothetical protein